MNCLLYVSSSSTATVFLRTTRFITTKSSSFGFSTSSLSLSLSSSYSSVSSLPFWKKGVDYKVFSNKPIGLRSVLTRFQTQYYSSSATTTTTATRRKRVSTKLPQVEPEPGPQVVMEEDKGAFYVVRKGDVVGVYKSLIECQAQVGTVCDPSVSVYKGSSLRKDTEDYLTSRGLKNAIYSISAAHVNDDLFGELTLCPFEQPASSKGKASKKPSPKRSLEVLESESDVEEFGSTFLEDTARKLVKLKGSVKAEARLSKCVSCTLEFDGASKGNPGLAGAGAILRADDGSLVCRLREGVGIATNNVAEYRACILGLKHALKEGFKRICVQGDSKLVTMQVQGLWKTKNENMSILCKEAKELKDKFMSFQIKHVLRNLNSEADTQANLAITLADGDVQADCEAT
ncbi:hypothetical protein GIB67_035050 [Kingdonia uniflora]|uniref:RNase H type-1 domain-containing protein n=1 Tax=Kingdonia uniflora TaxID=39325 RepID=A0A7J7L1J3_9MAGN|nr:hypothetical protein GIB67_035050 [Kingdonia uniflora]